MEEQTTVNHDKLMALFGSVFNDVAGSVAIMMSYIGDQTGVYRAMDKLGPSSVASIAEEAKVDERYLKEWLASNAARGYVHFNAESEEFSLTPEQAAVFLSSRNYNRRWAMLESIIKAFDNQLNQP